MTDRQTNLLAGLIGFAALGLVLYLYAAPMGWWLTPLVIAGLGLLALLISYATGDRVAPK